MSNEAETGALGGEASGDVVTDIQISSMNDSLRCQHLYDVYEFYHFLDDWFHKAV